MIVHPNLSGSTEISKIWVESDLIEVELKTTLSTMSRAGFPAIVRMSRLAGHCLTDFLRPPSESGPHSELQFARA